MSLSSTPPLFVVLPVLRQVLYPVLMVIMVCRIIFVRVRPDDLIVFEPIPDEDPPDRCGDQHDRCRRFFSRVKAGWDESSSLFSWADKGQWTTTETTDQEARREGDGFRIGFEPLFVDFTKRGSWFMAYSLVEVKVPVRTDTQMALLLPQSVEGSARTFLG